jgi:hypothetical protein
VEQTLRQDDRYSAIKNERRIEYGHRTENFGPTEHANAPGSPGGVYALLWGEAVGQRNDGAAPLPQSLDTSGGG